MYPRIFFLLILNVTSLLAQDSRIIIKGQIMSDSIFVENTHIVNKNSNKGTISNNYGEFSIFVKENDTLLISGIQYYNKIITISEDLVRNKFIKIILIQKTYELQEVKVNTHYLSGRLSFDTRNVSDTISIVNKEALDFSKFDFTKPILGEVDDVHLKDPTDINQQNNPNTPITGDVKKLLLTLFDPLINKNDVNRKPSTLKLNKERIYNKSIIDFPEKLVSDFGEHFFTVILKIPIDEITPFINHCTSKGIIELYVENRKLEVLDILIQESKLYRPFEN